MSEKNLLSCQFIKIAIFNNKRDILGSREVSL